MNAKITIERLLFFIYNKNRGDTMEFIEITKDDAYEYSKVSSKCWLESYKGIIDDDFLELINTEEEIKKQANRIIENFDDKSLRYLVKDNNQTIGIFRIRITKYDIQDAIELGALYILSDYKKRGIGKNIWEFVINKAKELGYKKLVVGCLANNPSNEFYKHMGAKFLQTNPLTINNKEYIENVYFYEL